jgi:hypothetical protein
LKKLAIFVEGQTEQIFVQKLVCEIAGEKRVTVQEEKAASSTSGLRRFIIVSASGIRPESSYYVLIRDCGGDSTVKSDIGDSCESLTAAGYTEILGLRDVYPLSAADIPRLEASMKFGLPTRFAPIRILFAVMETEAWFIAEETHFERIHPRLMHHFTFSHLRFDPCYEDVEGRPHPSEDLDNAYRLVAMRYTKKRSKVQRTVNALDFAEVYFTLPNRVKSLKNLVDELDQFFT